MDISNSVFLYQLFYVIAFLVAYIVLVAEGYHRKFPLLTWILILAGLRLAVVAGTKLFSYSPDEWHFMFRNHCFLPNSEKSMFGGFLAGVAVYLVARNILKFRHPAWDTAAYAFPLAVSIQSIGCFFYGCCFGTGSELPWAVQYPVMSLAHYHQFNSGLIGHGDLYSLPVHPVQLYNCLGGLIALSLTFLFRRHWKAKGSLLLSSVIFFSIIRFITEFFMDPLSNKSGGEMLWMFKQVQWQYLLFAFIMILLLAVREKSYRPEPEISSSTGPGLNIQIAFLSSLVLMFLLLRNWFTITEIVVLNIALLPAVIMTGIELAAKFASSRYKWLYACTVILPVFLMSQTVPVTRIGQPVEKKFNTYHSITGGMAGGHYSDKRTIYTGSGCDRITDEYYFDHKYTAGGAGYSLTKKSTDSDIEITYGGNILFGNYKQAKEWDSTELTSLLIGLNPFIKYDTRWVGIGGGLHIGNMIYTTGDTRKNTTIKPDKAFFKTPVFPQFYLRVGLRKYFFADLHIADQLPVSSPGLAFLAGIGSGLGLNNGTNLRFGTSMFDKGSLYVSAFIPIENKVVLQPLFLWTSGNLTDGPVKLPEKQFSLGISYRFGFK
jgi:prolipoprotein diacylglyceryltransferase